MIMKQVYKLSILLFLLTLFGCKENLYSNLSERDVNMMIAILEQSGIEAERYKDDTNKYSLRVESADFTNSVKVLSAKGYPKKKFQSMADVFSAEGIVKTPFEQRARYIHALNQELSRSISDIEGVISARVHITQPEISRFGKTTEKPRAAVVILHYPSRSMSGMRPKIKQLIAHSVNGMTYENVTVVMTAVDEVNSRIDKLDSSDTIRHVVAAKATPKSYIFAGSTLGQILPLLLVLVGVTLAIMSMYFWQKAKRNDS